MTPATAIRTVRLALFALSLLGVAGCRPTQVDPTQGETTLRATLAAHRAEQIERLHAYAVAGEFPHNVTTPGDLHMFRDAEGRYCAVANLVHRDGRDDLVEATVRERNDLAIADVHDGAMMKWVLESGLTQEELARIQLPARPFVQFDSAPHKLPAPRRATPVDEVARKKAAEPAPVAVAVPPPVITEEAMKALVRAHLAEVETELRAHADASLTVAVERAHTGAAATKVASR